MFQNLGHWLNCFFNIVKYVRMSPTLMWLHCHCTDTNHCSLISISVFGTLKGNKQLLKIDLSFQRVKFNLRCSRSPVLRGMEFSKRNILHDNCWYLNQLVLLRRYINTLSMRQTKKKQSMKKKGTICKFSILIRLWYWFKSL